MIIENLVEYLKKCDDAYYNTENPLVSNDTYDAMVNTLKKLDHKNEYLQKIGAHVPSDTQKIARTVPMGTLSKYHKTEDVKAWLRDIQGSVLLAPKYDGFGVELLYIDGALSMASTRGDGYVGEDVLPAMQLIHNVPKELPEGLTVRVRGEVIIPRINHEIMKNLGYAAMRNAVPGIVRSCRKDALDYVDFVAYEFIEKTNRSRSFQREFYKQYFTVEQTEEFTFSYFDKLLEARNKYGEQKDSYTYEIDGVVLKTDEVREDDYLFPKYQIAWKFKSNRETTVLKDVEYQMGVTGRFTPIGIFEEVEFQGAKLTRASLGNMTRFYSFKNRPGKGSVVEVSRRGDIIPYIEDVVFNDESVVPFVKLTHCPHCGEELQYEELEPCCKNHDCPEKIKMRISQYVSSVGIKGLGWKLVYALIDAGYVKNIIDIYSLDASVIATLPRQGESGVKKWEELQNKKLSFLQLLSAYPFVDISKKFWEKLLESYTFEEILNLTQEDFEENPIKGIGTSKITNFLEQMPTVKEELSALSKICVG